MAAHFLLIRVDGLNASSVSEILLIPNKEDAVRRWLMQAEAFIAAHLEEAGVSKNGNDWLQGVDWSALSDPAKQPHCGPGGEP